MPACDNCGNPAEFKVYLNKDRKHTGSVPIESPLYVISCVNCLKGYEVPGTETIQCFTPAKKAKKKVYKQSSFL